MARDDDPTAPDLGTFQIGARAPLFFMHIPKTAGTSMRLYLGEQYRRHEVYPWENWQQIQGQERDIRSFHLVRGHFRYNMRTLVADGTRMLTVLREPLRRTLSALRHTLRDPNFERRFQLAKNTTLSDVIRNPDIMAFHRDAQARFLCASMIPDDVAAYLAWARSQDREADAGDLEEPPELRRAMDRLELIDFVGLTENIGAVISMMVKEMNYHPSLYFPVVNENPDHIDSLYGLNDDDLNIVREYNQIDLPLYEFARKLIERRNFDRAMHHLVYHGVYQIMSGSFELRMSDIIPGSGWAWC